MTAGIVEYARQDCPICGHRGWCGVRDDGLVLCKRPPTPREVPGFAFRGMAKDSATAMYVESGREFNNGHVKRSTPRTNTPGPSDAPREKRVTPEWLTENHPRLVANLDDERLAALAAELQLPASALDVMSIGWWPDRRWWNQETQQREGESGCWTFPEYDAQGRIIGLGLRWPAGHKGQLAGGRRGLSLTTDWRDLPDPVLVAEGPTDVLAGRCVGLNCIGRPNNSGGTDLLAHACRNRQVIVIGENDRKSDGRWPGKEGAESVAHRLEAAWGRPVPVAYPPTGIKDVRAWVLELGGGAADADASAIRATILNALQPPALVWLVGPRTKQGRVSVKVFRWADGPDAAPIHSDRLNPDQESDRKRFAKALAKVEPQTDIDQIAQRLVALNIPPNDGENSRRKPSARVRHAAATDVVDKDLPVVLLPGGPVPIQESAEQLGKLLAPSKRYFVRGGAIVTVAHDEAGQHILDTVKPAALASVFETVANLMTLGKSGGETVQQPAVCTEQQAKLIEYCETFQRALPPLRLLSACPVLIERNGSLVQICGYDCDSGIMALAAPADDVPLDEAVELLSELLSEFRFATAADRARAFAAIITPALVMGGLLGGRAPVDLGEADASQTGKGYRNKLTAAIYGQTVRTVTQKKGGVGSLEETFSTALIRGRNFIALDNVRGQIDSPAIESFLTEDSFLARAPHQAAVEIDPRRVIVCMTSNRAEITIDMANRSSCVRIQKQPDGYRFREYPEGDILDHVRANQPRYLGAVFAVVRAWHEAGKPRTDETAHDFRPWARTLDWIAQNILDAGPLLDGHRETQMRMATPVLNWLRDVALAVRDAAQMDIWLRAAQLVEVLVASAVDLPGLAEGGDMEDTEVRKKVLQAVGRRLGQCFRRENIVLIDGFEIERREDTDDEQRRTIREYRFRLRNPGPDECAYAPGPDGGRIGANPTSGGSEGNLEAPEDADSGLDAPVCAYGAPMVPLCVRLRNPAVAPIAPMGHVIAMRKHSDSEGVCLHTDKYRKVMEPIGALGANSRSLEASASVDPRPPPSLLTARWVSEACDHIPPSVVQLAVERKGWTPERWRDRLLYLAELCAEDNPGRAAELRQAADLMTGPAEESGEA